MCAQELRPDWRLAGSGGPCNVEVPLNRWGDRVWFRVALSVVGLSDRWVAQLFPGQQGGAEAYTGEEGGRGGAGWGGAGWAGLAGVGCRG